MTGLALRVSVPKWNVESELGYKPITTFWEDFSIADKFGNEAVMIRSSVLSLSGKATMPILRKW